MNFLIWLFKDILYLGATASLLIVLLLAVKKLFRRGLNPRWQYYIWVLLLVYLILPFQVQSPVSVYSLIYGAAASANLPVTETVNVLQNPLYETVLPVPAGSAADPDAPPAQLIPTGQTSDQIGVPPAHGGDAAEDGQFIKIAALVWLSGVSLFVLYTVCVNIAFALKVSKRYTPLRDERMQQILESCKAALGIQRQIPLLTTSREKRAPSLYGLLKPKILVSGAYLNTLGDDEVKYIFLHELIHFKRKDIAANWLLTVLQAVYFFNPLVWYAFHKIHEDCEISCDAEVLKYLRPDERLLYGGTIIKLIKLLSESNFVPVAGISKNKSSTKRRLTMISNFKRNKWTGTVLAIVLIAVIGLVGLTGCSTNVGAPTPNASSDSTGAPSESPSALPSPTSADSPDNTAASTAGEQAPAQDYYGQWTVKSVLAYGIGTYSESDAKKLIGSSLSFSADKAVYYNDTPSAGAITAKNPNYQESTLSAEDFLTNFHTTFDKLGITAGSINAVYVSNPDAGGCTLLVKDKNSMILVAGGTYFELTRTA